MESLFDYCDTWTLDINVDKEPKVSVIGDRSDRNKTNIIKDKRFKVFHTFK